MLGDTEGGIIGIAATWFFPAMPTLLREDGYEIRMYFNDHAPPHVHAFKSGGQAKIELSSPGSYPKLLLVQGMSEKEAKKAIEIVIVYQAELIAQWEEWYG